VLLADRGLGPDAVRVAVADTDSRYADARTAETVTAAALAGLPPETDLFVKVDSLLRGNVAAVTRAATALGRPVVLAVALPENGRVVRDGVPIIGGLPLHAAGLWRAELRPPPRTVQEALDDEPAEVVPLEVVRDPDRLRSRLELLARRGRVAIVDAVEPRDLDHVVETAWRSTAGPRAVLLGSGGLAAAVGRSSGGALDSALPEPGGAAPLVVVGSGSDAARRQFARLVTEVECVVVELDAARLLAVPAEAAGTLSAALRGRQHLPTAVRLEWTGDLRIDHGPDVTRALATAVGQAVADSGGDRPLTLIGGATARGVLDRLGVRRLTVLGALTAGAVASRTDAGTTIVTRPGGFGNDAHLIDILRTMSG
jgi:4-hydroxythreonine-4-phosphate dehydrogenase